MQGGGGGGDDGISGPTLQQAGPMPDIIQSSEPQVEPAKQRRERRRLDRRPTGLLDSPSRQSHDMSDQSFPAASQELPRCDREQTTVS